MHNVDVDNYTGLEAFHLTKQQLTYMAEYAVTLLSQCTRPIQKNIIKPRLQQNYNDIMKDMAVRIPMMYSLIYSLEPILFV